MASVILAVVEHPQVADRTLAGAGTLAELTGAARMNVLAIRIPPLETIVLGEEILSREAQLRIRADEQVRVAALREIFEAWAPAMRERGIAAEWHEVEQRADAAVAEWGCRADFVVLKRPWWCNPTPDRQAIHAALFDTDRPVLVVPPERPPAPFGRRVAIAWREDKRTIRAVLAALRWLGRAERIYVLAGVREGAQPPGLPDILAEHGLSAELHVLELPSQRAFGEMLLETAHGLGADMLVQGAYVRSPLRRLILGGVTGYMLTHADLPVLMRY
jgi:nucleotide-binding universal stress UspA family protein